MAVRESRDPTHTQSCLSPYCSGPPQPSWLKFLSRTGGCRYLMIRGFRMWRDAWEVGSERNTVMFNLIILKCGCFVCQLLVGANFPKSEELWACIGTTESSLMFFFFFSLNSCNSDQVRTQWTFFRVMLEKSLVYSEQQLSHQKTGSRDVTCLPLSSWQGNVFNWNICMAHMRLEGC